MGWRIYPAVWLVWLRSAQTTKFAVPNWFVILAFCSKIWVTRSIALTLTSDISRGFWFGLADLHSRLAGCRPAVWLVWLRSAQTTKFAVPNWFVILAFCSQIWVTRSIALTLTSDISRGFWFGLADSPSRLAGLAQVSPDN